jgi:hypothetical protein
MSIVYNEIISTKREHLKDTRKGKVNVTILINHVKTRPSTRSLQRQVLYVNVLVQFV